MVSLKNIIDAFVGKYWEVGEVRDDPAGQVNIKFEVVSSEALID